MEDNRNPLRNSSCRQYHGLLYAITSFLSRVYAVTREDSIVSRSGRSSVRRAAFGTDEERIGNEIGRGR